MGTSNSFHIGVRRIAMRFTWFARWRALALGIGWLFFSSGCFLPILLPRTLETSEVSTGLDGSGWTDFHAFRVDGVINTYTNWWGQTFITKNYTLFRLSKIEPKSLPFC